MDDPSAVLSLISTLALVGVTIWYAFQTQRMAKSARDSAESAKLAAESSARAAAVAASASKVDFHISPTYSVFDSEGRTGSWFAGVRVECSESAVFIHEVRIIFAWAPDPELFDIEPSLTQIAVFPEDRIPRLQGIDEPTLFHAGESRILDFDAVDWLEAEVAVLNVDVLYSFDGASAPRTRQLEWIGQPGRDYGPYRRGLRRWLWMRFGD